MNKHKNVRLQYRAYNKTWVAEFKINHKLYSWTNLTETEQELLLRHYPWIVSPKGGETHILRAEEVAEVVGINPRDRLLQEAATFKDHLINLLAIGA